MSAIAGGIETVAQAQALAAIGCPFGQGYLFGRAMPAGDATLDAVPGWPGQAKAAWLRPLTPLLAELSVGPPRISPPAW